MSFLHLKYLLQVVNHRGFLTRIHHCKLDFTVCLKHLQCPRKEVKICALEIQMNFFPLSFPVVYFCLASSVKFKLNLHVFYAVGTTLEGENVEEE